MIARSLSLAVVVAACHAHPDAAEEVRGEDCVSCHQADVAAVTDPVHEGTFPPTCADCHTIAGWTPALAGLHPTAAFPLRQGTHGDVACLECHEPERGPAEGGADTDCVGCHSGEHAERAMAQAHVGVPGYSFDAAQPSFCLRCHPTGEAADHPEGRFPISGGPHGPFACADCHDRSAGPDAAGANTDCIGCHTGDHSRAEMDDKHQDEAGYRWQAEVPSFCLDCHPSGRAEDD